METRRQEDGVEPVQERTSSPTSIGEELGGGESDTPEQETEASGGQVVDESSLAAPRADAAPHATSPATTARSAAGPSFTFLALVSGIALIADAVTKAWAETTLSQRTLESPALVLIEDVLAFQLAYNKGGAFGMLSGEDDAWRGPFFLLISVGAVAFIVSLYRRVAPGQWALKWGLPLVLGGALGNLADRITKGKVVDFIDYRAGWVETMNEWIHAVNSSWHVTSHWPTFNVADMCICAGVALMAIDMFVSSRKSTATEGHETSRNATVG